MITSMSYKPFGDDVEIYVYENFLTNYEIEYLNNYIKSKSEEGEGWEGELSSTKDTKTWENRNLFIEKNEVYDSIYNKFKEFYSENIFPIPLDSEVFSGLGPIARTQVGQGLALHDDMGPPELQIDNLHGGIIYLNEDFTGGELYYKNFDYIIKPKSGMLVVHSAKNEYTHGVKEVSSGTRYAITLFIKNPSS